MSKVAPTDEERLLLAEIDLGLAAEQFLRSAVGKYLTGRAIAQSDEAIDKLKVADPDDAKLIRTIQNDIWRADTFAQWITDAIRGGNNAEEQFIHGSDPPSTGD